MADYSGYWQCDECKASGTNYQGSHKLWCSVTVARAVRAREKHLEEVQQKEALNAAYAVWDGMPNESVFSMLLDLEDEAGERYYHYKEVKDQVDALKTYLRDAPTRQITDYIKFCHKQREEGRYDAVE